MPKAALHAVRLSAAISQPVTSSTFASARQASAWWCPIAPRPMIPTRSGRSTERLADDIGVAQHAVSIEIHAIGGHPEDREVRLHQLHVPIQEGIISALRVVQLHAGRVERVVAPPAPAVRTNEGVDR